jgi:hypothetical protein
LQEYPGQAARKAARAVLRWLIAAGRETGVMTALRSSSVFAGFRFPREVISVAVRWFLRYGLSYRGRRGNYTSALVKGEYFDTAPWHDIVGIPRSPEGTADHPRPSARGDRRPEAPPAAQVIKSIPRG